MNRLIDLIYVEIVYSSLTETYAQISISNDLEYINDVQFQRINNEIRKILNQLNALIRTIKNIITD